MAKKDNRNIAVAVNSFLPHSQAWIYRQVGNKWINPKVILCRHRENKKIFPFKNCKILHREKLIYHKIKAKTWWFWKNFPPRFTRDNRNSIFSALLENSIDIVHAYFGNVAAHYIDICHKLHIPLIVTFLGFDITSAVKRWPGYSKKLIQLFHDCPIVIANCHEMATRLVNMGCDIKKIRVSYFGIPLTDFPFIDRSQRIGPVRFLHAGRLTEKKGVPDVIKAFVQAFSNRRPVILDIVGDGEEMNLVRKTINEIRPINKVNLYGEQQSSKIINFLRQADVFILNSRTDSSGNKEGLPNSILEASATGLPTISTNHAGIPESIIDGKTGILVPEFDTSALAAAMKNVMDKNLRLKMGRAARTLMEEKFDLEICNIKLREIYDEVYDIYQSKSE